MKISGIYMILNKFTKDFYIGSSIDINKRISRHKKELENNYHHSIVLQRAFNKYTITNFEFSLFLETEKEFLLDLEQFCLDFLNPLYNIAKNSLAPMTNRKHSRKTLKLFKTIKRLKGKDHPSYGTKWSDELRAKMIIIRTGKKRSLKTRKKMSETAKRINSISRINRDTMRKKVQDNLGNIFKSLTDASKFHKISKPTCCDILKGRHYQTRKGISFKYV